MINIDEEYRGFNKKNDEFDISDKKDTLIKSCILFSGIKAVDINGQYVELLTL